MRIISQDGMIDVNYDLGNLSIAKGSDDSVAQRSIYFHSCSCLMSTKLATYSTDEKAQKAMEMLQEFRETIGINNIPVKDISDNDFLKKIEKHFKIYTSYIGSTGLLITLTKSSDYFRFPQDSEIEVQ